MRDGLDFAVRRDGATVTAVVRGELDVTTADPLADALRDVGPGDRLVLDLRELDFMDSTGVRLLMRLDVRARDEGWQLIAARSPGVVARLLDLCRLGDRIRIVDDPEEAA